MKVSIIIPIRNEEHGIDKTIEQLEINLKNLPYEIIFINDFSTDNTYKTIEKIIQNKDQIKIYNNKIALKGNVGSQKSIDRALSIIQELDSIRLIENNIKLKS